MLVILPVIPTERVPTVDGLTSIFGGATEYVNVTNFVSCSVKMRYMSVQCTGSPVEPKHEIAGCYTIAGCLTLFA